MNTPIERLVAQALQELADQKWRSMRQASKFYELPYELLRRRKAGATTRQLRDQRQQLLHPIQEGTIVAWIRELGRSYLAVTNEMILDLAAKLAGENMQPGLRWLTAFRKRHPELKTGPGRVISQGRIAALDADIVTMVFDKLFAVRTQHGIKPCDIYNMDETGFRMGRRNSEQVVYDRHSGPPVLVSTEGGGWTTVVETVDATGKTLAPFFIHVGKVWYNHYIPKDDGISLPIGTRFAISEKGWINNPLGIEWLKTSFIPQAKWRQKSSRILLILDNQESHIQGQFLDICQQNGIELVWIPAHSSHILQPLDLGAFGPMKQHYTSLLKRYSPTGMADINRETFVKLYMRARRVAFRESNVLAGWLQTGIEPHEPSKVLDHKDVINADRATPDMTLPPREVYSSPVRAGTPISVENDANNDKTTADIMIDYPVADIVALTHEAAAELSPELGRRIRQLGRSAIKLKSSYIRLDTEYKLHKRDKLRKEKELRLKRLQVDAAAKSLSLQGRWQ